MKIAAVEHLHADAGQRNFDFLKITADNGLVGWSEYNESFGGPGVSAVIERLAPSIVGQDPRNYEAHVALMQAQASRPVRTFTIGFAEKHYDEGVDASRGLLLEGVSEGEVV